MTRHPLTKLTEQGRRGDGPSGHGVMHSPALGQLLAEMILDGAARSMDVHPLRPSRFAEGQPNAAPEFL